MARTDRNKRIDRQSAGKYQQTGRAFLDAAQALADLAGEDESYGNAIALLAVHAAISYTDAITISYGERKSTSGDHEQSVTLLGSVLGNRLLAKQKQRILKLAKLKDAIAYQGKYFPLEEAVKHLESASEFVEWADQLYQKRPV